MNDILNYWPYPNWKPRENQITALNWLSEQSAKYLLLQAPVGSGKSAIAVTYSHFLNQRTPKYRGDSFILTPQRILQKQYEDSHRNISSVNISSFYGKSNYTCKDKHISCEIGSIVKPKCTNCPFTNAKKQAIAAADTVLNYKLALVSFAYTETFTPRKLLVFDECHTLENHLVDFDALQITEWRNKKYKIKFKPIKSLKEAKDWLGEYYIPEMRKVICKLDEECEPFFEKSGDALTRSEITKIRELKSLQEHIDEAAIMSVRTDEYINENFVLTTDAVMFQFKRITGAYSFHKHLNTFANRFLFMSSTILDKDGFCEDLGIPEDDAAFLSLDSDFPKENRPIYYMPQMKMNAKWKLPENAKSRKEMVNSIKKLLEIHKDDSGIIHTGNFQVAEWLVEELKKTNHIVYHHNPESENDRNAVIDEFISNPKPSVLISPSSTEGLDLSDELGRFAIFVKLGFPYLGDAWIKRRMEMSHKWYIRKTLTDVIQGGGRIVRSNTDQGSVYILDSSFAYLRKESYHLMPKWWRESIETI